MGNCPAINWGEKPQHKQTKQKQYSWKICSWVIFFFFSGIFLFVFSSPEPSGSQGELIVYPCSGVRCRRRCRCRCRRRRCRRRQQCLNIFSSETAWPIKAKLYVELPWEGGKFI